ncbi:MAG TPA: ankyrin repeat domain-containing protein, partial [Nitrososphaeraceae archaeon]|nr:ankyrin repeat domain-containing protein [Nitrososphaeraceae archaeon]
MLILFLVFASLPSQEEEFFCMIDRGNIDGIFASEHDTHELSRVANSNGETLLIFSIRSGYFDAAKQLLSRGIDPTVSNSLSGPNPLDWAITLRQVKLARLLLNAGSESEGYSALAIASFVDCPDNILRQIQSNREITALELRQALDLAVYARSFRSISELIRHQSKPLSPLVVAVLQGNHPELDVCLAEKVPNVNEGLDLNGNFSDTPLMYAVRLGRHEIAKKLITAGAEVSAKHFISGTPLMIAADYEDIEMVRLLLDSGADPNLGNGDYTPIMRS